MIYNYASAKTKGFEKQLIAEFLELRGLEMYYLLNPRNANIGFSLLYRSLDINDLYFVY